MIECHELVGKVIRQCRIDKDGKDGPEINIEFTDDTTFSICVSTDLSIRTDAKAGRKRLAAVKDFTKSNKLS